MPIKRIILILFLSFQASRATDSCVHNNAHNHAELGIDALLVKNMLNDPLFNQAFEETTTPQTPENRTQNDKFLNNKKSNRYNFYNDYMAKYYPKAFVVRINFFLCMSPAEIEKSLKDIVNLLTSDPWFYFVNNKHEIQITHYWEYIIDQLRILNDFLVNALVDTKSQKVFLPKDYDVEKVLESNLFFADNLDSGMNDKKVEGSTPLIEQLLICGTTTYDFYALCFDYLIKLFNEKIVCDELAEAHMYFYDLEELVSKLQGSLYEIAYQEHLKTAKELVDMLKACREKQKSKKKFLSKSPEDTDS